MAAADEARAKFDAGDTYEAALLAKTCQDENPDSSAAEACDELLAEIREALADQEPKTGELERTFQIQGRHTARVTAASGAIVMTVADSKKPSDFVRFYIRQGETSEVYLPAGVFDVDFTIGDIWFDDTVGFGELGESYSFSSLLEFEADGDSAWVPVYTWSPTI